MTEGSGTGLHARDAVTPGSVPVSPPPHPVRRGIMVRRRPATIAVRRSDMQAVSVTPVRGKNCCLVKSLMCCFIETGMVCVDFGSVYFVRVAGQEDKHDSR